MTFQEYVIEEINDQEVYDDIDFDDSSMGYTYDLEYTIQE